MFRRRTAALPSAAPGPAAAVPVPVARLEADGWVLPKGIGAGQDGHDPAWTLIGTVGSSTATPIDPAGLVVGEGWSLDWWIGADDRWHLPAQEAAVRQSVLDDVPIIETLVRSGRYQNASEVVREGLRLVEQRTQEEAARLEALRKAADIGWNALATGDYSDVTEDGLSDFIDGLGRQAADRVHRATS